MKLQQLVSGGLAECVKHPQHCGKRGDECTCKYGVPVRGKYMTCDYWFGQCFLPTDADTYIYYQDGYQPQVFKLEDYRIVDAGEDAVYDANNQATGEMRKWYRLVTHERWATEWADPPEDYEEDEEEDRPDPE